MKRSIAAVLALLLFISALTGCAETPAVTTETAPETTEAATAEETAAASVTEEETEEETTAPETEPEFTVTPDGEATLTIPRTFGSHMVVQRGKDIKIFGKSNRDGKYVRGVFKGETAYSKVENGKFTLTFSPKEASAEPDEMVIEDECGNVIRFEDVLVGDVWILTGQSNAAVTLSYLRAGLNGKLPELDENEPVRLLMQGVDYFLNNKLKAKEPMDDFADPSVVWTRETKQAGMSFSALGLFFAKKVTSLTGVPVGVICTAASGAQIQEIMPKAAAEKCKLRTSLKVAIGGFYNGMMAPLEGMAFAGVVFFQGESEGILYNTAVKFNTFVTEYVSSVRERLGYDFPFYQIQLSSYSDSSRANFGYVNIVRLKQYESLSSITNGYLIPSYDLRSPDKYADYMHSPRKEELGDRVALLVCANEYGIGSAEDYSAPVPEEVKLSEDGLTVTVKFKYTGGGLVSKSGDSTVKGFFIGNEKKRKAAEAELISDDTVLVHVPEGAKAENVAYGFDLVINDDNTQLFSKSGLPVLAFSENIK